MKSFKRFAVILALLLPAVFCQASDATLMVVTGCAKPLQTDSSGCAGQIGFSGPFSISITPECVAGARSAVVNQLLTGNTLSANSYNEYLQMSSTKDLVAGIYFGLAAVGITSGIIALQSDLPGMEKASWATFSLLSPVAFYYMYKVTLPAFVDEKEIQSKLRKSVDDYNSACAQNPE